MARFGGGSASELIFVPVIDELPLRPVGQAWSLGERGWYSLGNDELLRGR